MLLGLIMEIGPPGAPAEVSIESSSPPSVSDGIQLTHSTHRSQACHPGCASLLRRGVAVSPYLRERHRHTDHPDLPELCRFWALARALALPDFPARPARGGGNFLGRAEALPSAVLSLLTFPHPHTGYLSLMRGRRPPKDHFTADIGKLHGIRMTGNTGNLRVFNARIINKSCIPETCCKGSQAWPTTLA